MVKFIRTSCCENTDADVVTVALMLVLFVNTHKNHRRSLTEDVYCLTVHLLTDNANAILVVSVTTHKCRPS